MNFSENDNIYEFNARNVLTEYAEFVEGTPECLVAVCSHGPLSADARQAIAASCAKLKAGECAWITTAGIAGEGLFALVEGLDPKVIIAADKGASDALGEAYGCAVLLDAASRVFGRTCVAFRDFAGMLEDGASKQRAWALLKQLG